MNIAIETATLPQWANNERTAINLRVRFTHLAGEVDFTATADDATAYSADLFNRAITGEFGEIAAYVPAPLPVPSVVTMRQARLALLQNGMLTQVNTAVANMPGAAGDTARIEWEFSSTVERNRPLVQSLIGALSLTESQLDDLFRLAASL